MLKDEIKPGTDYALREKRMPDLPFQRVRVLEHIRGSKWKAKWIQPNPGLTDYVDSNQLIVPWKEHKAFLEEEGNEKRIREYNVEHGYKTNSPIIKAMGEVFESIGEEEISFSNGCLIGFPDAIDRLRQRAGIKSDVNSPPAYQDRRGKQHLAFKEAFELARSFAVSEPATVLVRIEATEREWSRTASRPGEEYIIDLLNEYRAAWALVRQWAGYDAAVAQREAEIRRLEALVWDAIYSLQKAKLDSEAARLRRAMNKG